MKLLNSIKIKGITLPNRITVGSMCQYSAIKGNPSLWHYGHLQKLAQTGAGMLMLESTAVSMEGRISLKDLTLINRKNVISFKKLLNHIKSFSKIPVGIQISHSGRKGSARIPWEKSNTPLKKQNGGWTTYAPSPIRRDKKWPVPKELSIKKIKKIIKQFKNSATLANKAGFDCLEVHMAHGYLLHEFFSPISNKRKDIYGSNLENRCRFLCEIFKEVRKVWPKKKILSARVNGQDWLPNGSTVNDCIYLVKKLKKIGIDYVCVTSGGILPKTNLKFGPGYQVHLAKKVKSGTRVRTRTTGMITNLKQANNILKNKNADLINIARKFINSPTWLISEVIKHNKKIKIPNPYTRCF